MKQILSVILIFSAAVLFNSCKKEYSAEGGIPTGGGNGNTNNGTSRGTLGGSPGTCSNTIVSGAFVQTVALTDSNYIVVDVTVDTIGTYTIGTDTVNGVYFLKSGNFTVAGAQTVKLKAFGTPLNAGTFTQTVKYKSSSCTFDITVSQVVVAPIGDYFPTTTGSNWTYLPDNPTATQDDTIRTTSIGTMATFAGNSYSIFESADKTGSKDSSYFRKGGGLYYEYGDLDGIGITDNGVFGEMIMLKDNVAQGNSWESAVFTVVAASVPGTFKVVSTLKEKNVTKQIGSKSYVNVMVVKNSYQLKVLITPFTEIYTSEVWYAKGVGIINAIATIPGAGSSGFSVQRFKIN